MNKRENKLAKWRMTAILFLSIYIVVMLYNVYKPLPENISYESKEYLVSDGDIDFFYNVTGERNGRKFFKEEIFTRTLEIIDEADKFIVIDYFLFNSYHEKDKEYPGNVKNITDALLVKKRENPEMPIIFISDEVNSSYNSHNVPEFEQMKEAGIDVVMTNMDPLRDSTPVYSGIYRMLFTWFGDSHNGWLSNAFVETAPDMTIRSYLTLFNVKANHRKTLTTEKTTLISSANPHDASAYFANAAFEVKGALVNDMLKSEKAAADTRRDTSFPKSVPEHQDRGSIRVQLVTEGKVQEAIRNEIAKTVKGDEIWLAMFYLADRTVVEGLTDAANRGVEVKLILDTNKNSFGRKKTGLPNVPMASELIEDTDGKVKVRWFVHYPEQFHPKMMYVKQKKESVIISGSANHTSRNLNNFNLETDVKISSANDSKIMTEVNNYFHMLWGNEGAVYTADYHKHAEDIAITKRIIYTIQKLLHFTTF
ncbi:phospholipase D-like domain-containing protein [Domibacillus epiphyticus]|uniref:phospholipase D-like domain-containing protein n=1 Tax=Domibacillus epiphyticus TaxID=1714355 RepID=UPI0013015DCB|nr:phospholipase D-like domain-containing protein [Domibacillus epiphyticus]